MSWEWSPQRGSLQWYRNQLGEAAMTAARRKKVDPYELLTAEAARAPRFRGAVLSAVPDR
ncbi:MAG: hypothetical protein CM1200mP2_53220 [Planctomycetaceae bacterium]|nr:MAG: hypothetical protein CM1200mP2_53220 [Planctomycetaceae bacterium]